MLDEYESMWEEDDAQAGADEVAALDALTLTAVRTTDMSADICDKVISLVSDAGHKSDYEKWGRYITNKMSTQYGAEIPSVLHSRFLSHFEPGQSPVDKLKSDPIYQAAIRGELKEELDVLFNRENATKGLRDWDKEDEKRE